MITPHFNPTTPDEHVAYMLATGVFYNGDRMPCSVSALRAAAKRRGDCRVWQTTDRNPWGKTRRVYILATAPASSPTD